MDDGCTSSDSSDSNMSDAEPQSYFDDDADSDGVGKKVLPGRPSALEKKSLELSRVGPVGSAIMKKTHKKYQTQLANFMFRLKKKQGYSDDLHGKFEKFIGHAADRNYHLSAQIYVDMTIGNHVKYHDNIALGEAKHNKGYWSRRKRRCVGTEFTEDDEIRQYVLAVKLRRRKMGQI